MQLFLIHSSSMNRNISHTYIVDMSIKPLYNTYETEIYRRNYSSHQSKYVKSDFVTHTLEALPVGVAAHATSSRAVSRRFVARSTRRMHEFLSRALDEFDIRVVFIDGKAFRDHCLLIALGLDSQGRKHVLGLREGSTENARVAGPTERVGRARPDHQALNDICGRRREGTAPRHRRCLR